ncbi:flagellin hook IN motif-containing protein [Hansschlegelia sp. KR7-227]|jgi:flagellin|uniref:flagellin N-terminal helical domain-containing protein n=1 Tax=Hansschlegelia sp. KR7-227 TaxID=3400914 RepID=UPI003C0CB4EC
MADVTLNSAVRSNLRTLQSTTDLMNRTEERLSTGKKVNSALDNPSSFFTSQALDRRSSDLNSLMDNVSNSVKTLEAADNGIKAITSVVESLKASARSALQSPKGVEAAVTGAAFTAANLTATPIEINDVEVTLAANDTVETVVEKINAAEISGVTASVSGGQIKLTSSDDIVIAGTVTGTGLTAGTTVADDVIDQDAVDKRAAYLDDFNEALKQITSLAKDASFNGVNLLQSDDLEITFNEDGDSTLDVKGTNFDAAGLGLSELATGDFNTKSSIEDVLDTIESAFSTLESQASKFGSQLQIVETRQTFTKDMIGTLDDGALALIGADTNEEAANLATLQTRQALIVSSLSISTSQESNVLQLLR